MAYSNHIYGLFFRFPYKCLTTHCVQAATIESLTIYLMLNLKMNENGEFKKKVAVHHFNLFDYLIQISIPY